MSRLRIHIDEDWDAIEFSQFFLELHKYYEFVAIRVLTVAFAPSSDEVLLQRFAALGKPLRVRRIEFGSKGFTDLLGAAALIGELRTFVEFLIVHFREMPDRKLERQERQIAIADAKLELMKKMLHLRKETRLHESDFEFAAQISEFVDMPGFEAVAEAIMDKRVLRVEQMDEDDIPK